MPESLKQKNEFDEIRPFYDEEVNAAINRLLQEEEFLQGMKFLFPDWDEDNFAERLSQLETVKEFQKILMYPAVNAVKDKTIRGITTSGFENKIKEEAYLYISNHRDIILDSALLNILLFEHGLDTCEVAIGSNLLVRRWIEELVRLNRNFIVHRDIPPKLLYPYSLRLSKYIRQDLVEKKMSVWLAQRQGRTKNGRDETQAGLLKMLSISGDADLIRNFSALKIVPMAISYEYEPCDYMKARELYVLKTTGKYKKGPEDDLKSMLVGLTSYKGRIHMDLGEPILGGLQSIDHSKNKNDQIKELADLIDQKIYSAYKLWPTNYIAHDLLGEKSEFSNHYTPDEKEQFEEHMKSSLLKIEEPSEEVKPLFLKIYAEPVNTKLGRES